jgi:hypothetical protein
MLALLALLVAWIVFPLLLAALSFGCGRLLEAASGAQLPGPLVLPAGLTVVILIAQFTTLTDETAGASGIVVVVAAAAGLLLALRRRDQVDPWALVAAASVFAVFAAPVVLSGSATFAGYIKLDDTATYFAMADRVMEHARTLAGLAPSTYEETLRTTLEIGYPTGSLMPLGVGHQLLSYDVAWLFQPYLAFLATMLALALYAILDGIVTRPWLRAASAFLAAQPALLFGYGLWGGIKELAGAFLLTLIAALLPWTLDDWRGLRAVLPLAAACAALVCVLSVPGAVWLAPALVAGAAIARRATREVLVKAGAFTTAAAVLAIPAIVAAVDWLPRVHTFRSEDELANLVRPLSGFQLFGIWLHGDFRVGPGHAVVAYLLIAVVIATAVVGIAWAWRRRGWALLAYLATAGVGCGLLVAVSSPWVDAKAFAMASPAFLAAAVAGGATRIGRAALVPIAVGVLWSNVLQYHDVWLAPRGQLHELETIGERFAGEGPALMTAYEPYGARHFLRRLDPEGAAELRRRYVYLTNGKLLPKGESADIDRIRLDGLLVYRTLVLRRGPAASRPPSVYRLVWSGRYYEVWQRPERQGRTILEHLPLGNANEAAAVPRCADVMRLAAKGTALVTATRPRADVIAYPPASGSVAVRVIPPRAGTYRVWLEGDWFGRASVTVDGRKTGSKREELNWPGLYTELGRTRLADRAHVVRLDYETGGPAPGSAGTPYSLGPLVLSADDRREPVETVPSSQARSLCGRRLDWIEAVRSVSR